MQSAPGNVRATQAVTESTQQNENNGMNERTGPGEIQEELLVEGVDNVRSVEDREIDCEERQIMLILTYYFIKFPNRRR